MDRGVIEEKLESLRRCILRIETKRPARVDVSESEERPPESMAESFDILHRFGILSESLAHRLKSAVGFRDVAVHEYEAVNWEIVYTICQEHTEDFRHFAQCVVHKLDKTCESC